MNDPIVEEIRRFRQEHTDQFHGNLAAICRDLQKLQQTCGHPVVTFQPKPLKPHKRSDAESDTFEAAA